MPNREALFISHATPQQNAFARWLGAKLAAMGYEVWADIMRLRGGADWSRRVEEALNERTIKLLVVASPISMAADGVRNEIEIGARLAKELKDHEFIIPLRLQEFQPHIRIAHAQYIDFKNSWGAGLAELVELLTDTYRIPRGTGVPLEDWLLFQTEGATRLIQEEERLESNWLRVENTPNNIFYSEPPSGFPLEQFQNRTLHSWPIVPTANGVISFAEPSEDGLLAPNLPARRIAFTDVDTFLERGWKQLGTGISEHDARRQFADLGNQAFERFLQSRGLKAFEGANKRLSWWGAIGTVPTTKVRFGWTGYKGARQIIGQSRKRDVHWHYAINGAFRTAPLRHLRIYARLAFSENGQDAITKASRVHRLRRSLAKGWRNARWRDMLLAFLWWLSGGKHQLLIPVSQTRYLQLGLPPLNFTSPISVAHAGVAPPDEDDPDIDEDFEDDDESSDDEPSRDPETQV
jgi:hypothetical protein